MIEHYNFNLKDIWIIYYNFTRFYYKIIFIIKDLISRFEISQNINTIYYQQFQKLHEKLMKLIKIEKKEQNKSQSYYPNINYRKILIEFE